MRTPNLTAEEVFNRTRLGVSRTSNNEQIPWVASSLIEAYSFGNAQTAVTAASTPAPTPSPAPTPAPAPRPAPATSSAPTSPTPAPSQPAVGSATLVPETVPFIADRARATIRNEYVPAADHKALAISFNRIGFTSGQTDDETAKAAALDICKSATEASGSKNVCHLYAVGNTVVFRGVPPMPPPPWLVRNPAVERPFASKDLPLMNDNSRAFWDKTYPRANKTKALALAPQGEAFDFAGIETADEAIRRALESCGYTAGVPCMIVAVDDNFVVPIPTTMKIVGIFHAGLNSRISPELREPVAQRLGNATNGWNAVAVGSAGRPGLKLNAGNEQDAVNGALTDCGRQDNDCHVIAIGPFAVDPAVTVDATTSK
jgi:adenylate cyclase